MHRKRKSWFIVVGLFLALTGCDLPEEQGGAEMRVSEKVSVEEWQILAQKRIVFGHQSVGNNILDGVKSLADEAGVSFPITSARDRAVVGITHFAVGKNEDPRSKITDFVQTLNAGMGQQADVALVKLCYVDVTGGTEIKNLVDEYSESLEQLSITFPQTIFIAVTVPLTTVQSGPKSWVKKLLGRSSAGYAENYYRMEFNLALRQRFNQQGLLFDLALAESDTSRTYSFQGTPIEVLNPTLTDDGGHLNAAGQQLIATRLLKILAALPQR